METTLIIIGQILAGFLIGRGLGGLMNSYNKAKNDVLRIYRCLMLSDKKIKSEQITMEKAKNDFDYYLEEIKKYEGEKKIEMVVMLEESAFQAKKSEEKIYNLQKRAIRIHDLMGSSFIMHMHHRNNIRRLEEAKMEKNNATD